MTNYALTDMMQRIRALYAQGYTTRRIARALSISKDTVLRYHPKNAEALVVSERRRLERVRQTIDGNRKW